MITIGKTKSVCPECMKVVPAIKGIGEDGIYLVKECNAHGKFQTLIWEGNAADYLSWGRENLSAETPVNPKVKDQSQSKQRSKAINVARGMPRQETISRKTDRSGE